MKKWERKYKYMTMHEIEHSSIYQGMNLAALHPLDLYLVAASGHERRGSSCQGRMLQQERIGIDKSRTKTNGMQIDKLLDGTRLNKVLLVLLLYQIKMSKPGPVYGLKIRGNRSKNTCLCQYQKCKGNIAFLGLGARVFTMIAESRKRSSIS